MVVIFLFLFFVGLFIVCSFAYSIIMICQLISTPKGRRLRDSIILIISMTTTIGLSLFFIKLLNCLP